MGFAWVIIAYKPSPGVGEHKEENGSTDVSQIIQRKYYQCRLLLIMYTYMHPRDKAQLGAYHMKLLSWLCLSRHMVTGVTLLWEYTPLQLQAVTYVPFPWVLQSINDLAKFPAVGWLLLVAGT